MLDGCHLLRIHGRWPFDGWRGIVQYWGNGILYVLEVVLLLARFTNSPVLDRAAQWII